MVNCLTVPLSGACLVVSGNLETTSILLSLSKTPASLTTNPPTSAGTLVTQ